METFAVLDDGAQRTMILPTAVQQLQLIGMRESLALRTVQPGITHLSGSRVTFEISPKDNPGKRYRPIIPLRHTTVKQAQLRMSVAKDKLLPGLLHLECRSGYHIALATGLQGLILTF